MSFREYFSNLRDIIGDLFVKPVYVVNDNESKKNDDDNSNQQQKIRELTLENKKNKELISLLKAENKSLKENIIELLKKI